MSGRALSFHDRITLKSFHRTYLKIGDHFGEQNMHAGDLANDIEASSELRLINPEDHSATGPIHYGQSVSLRAPDDVNFLSAWKSNLRSGEIPEAYFVDHQSTWETWILQDPNDLNSTEAIHDGSPISFLSFHSTQLAGWKPSDENGEAGVFLVDHLDDWEMWQIETVKSLEPFDINRANNGDRIGFRSTYVENAHQRNEPWVRWIGLADNPVTENRVGMLAYNSNLTQQNILTVDGITQAGSIQIKVFVLKAHNGKYLNINLTANVNSINDAYAWRLDTQHDSFLRGLPGTYGGRPTTDQGWHHRLYENDPISAVLGIATVDPNSAKLPPVWRTIGGYPASNGYIEVFFIRD